MTSTSINTALNDAITTLTHAANGNVEALALAPGELPAKLRLECAKILLKTLYHKPASPLKQTGLFPQDDWVKQWENSNDTPKQRTLLTVPPKK